MAEDNYDILRLYKDILGRNNHHVVTAQDGEECLEIYREELRLMQSKKDGEPNGALPFDVVILDYKMPRKNGLEVAEEILAMSPHQRIVFASAYVKGTLADSIKKLGKVVEIIQKPFELPMLVDLIEDEKIYADLEKLNVNVHNLKGINPTHEQINDYLEALKIVQRRGV